jgi:hypothetical protein
MGCAWNTAAAQQKVTVEVGVESGRAETGAGAEVRERDILCGFRLKSGAETYSGKLRSVGVSGGYRRTLLWLVKAPPTVLPLPLPLGPLRQSYVADATAPADESPP